MIFIDTISALSNMAVKIIITMERRVRGKLACSVWDGGKDGDNIKILPIVILRHIRKCADESLLQDRASVFGGEVTDYMEFIRQNWLGKRRSDCVGLIKGCGWYDSASGEIVVGSNDMVDVGANAMFTNAMVKGTIDTINHALSTIIVSV